MVEKSKELNMKYYYFSSKGTSVYCALCVIGGGGVSYLPSPLAFPG